LHTPATVDDVTAQALARWRDPLLYSAKGLEVGQLKTVLELNRA